MKKRGGTFLLLLATILAGAAIGLHILSADTPHRIPPAAELLAQEPAKSAGTPKETGDGTPSSSAATEYVYFAGASLQESWRREFGLLPVNWDTNDLRRPFPSSVDSEAGSCSGWSIAFGGGEVLENNKDIKVLAGHSGVRYIELNGVSPRQLAALPTETLRRITHLSFVQSATRSPDDAADLKWIREKLPGLKGFSFTRYSLVLPDSVVNELMEFRSLSELGLHLSNRLPSRLLEWISSPKQLRRLDLSFSDLANWKNEVALGLGELEWLNVAHCKHLPHDEFWATVIGMNKLRCVGLGRPEDTGWTAKRVEMLGQRCKELFSLSLEGQIEDGNPLCDALNTLLSLRHLRLPRFSGHQELLELVKPTKLTKLHTLCMPHLTLSTVPWVVAQTELVELVTHVEGGSAKKLQGLFGKLSACSSLRSLDVSFNVVQVDAFDGLETLPITRLRVSGSTTPDGQAGIVKLLGACPSVNVLMYCMIVFRADDIRSYSEQIWAAIGSLDNVGTLAVYLPDHKRCRLLVADLPNLEILYDTHESSLWTREWVDALCTARKLKVVVKMGLKDDLYDAFAAKAPGVTVLRDVD